MDHLAADLGPDQRLAMIAADQIDHAVLMTDAAGLIIYANRRFSRLFGERATIGRSAVDLLAREGFDAGVMDRFRLEIAAGRTFQEEIPLNTVVGGSQWMSAVVKPLFNEDGVPANFLMVFSDLRDSKQIQQLQREVLEAVAQDRPLREVMDLICRRVEAMAPDVTCSIIAVDDERRLRPMAAPSLPAYFSEAIDGLPIGPRQGSCGTAAYLGEAVIVEDIATNPLWDLYKDLPLPLGLQACWSSPIRLRNGRVSGTFAFYYKQKRGPSRWHEYIVNACVALCKIALEREEAKVRIEKLAYLDGLTGLPNRASLREEMFRSFDEAESPQAALIFLDIDRFKDVNDTLGHAVGDAYLRQIADRLRASVWAEDFISRHGGDEFVIVLRGANAPRAGRVAEVLLAAISEPVVVDGLSLPASASIGIAVCPADGNDSATLLRNADAAMYAAKAEGRGIYRFFSPEMNQVAQDRVRLGAALRDAVANGQLQLAYQPQIDARSGALAGVEALSRWVHPVMGQVSPARFIALAEDTGVIDAIGEFCITEACRQLRAWDDAGLGVPQVAVNISPLHFRDPGLPGFVANALQVNKLEPHRLIVEITEGVMMDAYPAAIANARTLRASGVGISMDDFGTGYSSLSHLAKLPVTELKIDRRFMADLEENGAVRAMVTAVVRIGESLGLDVVAEGVETLPQRRFLEALGCDTLQGYLFAEALPPAAFATWASDWAAARQTERDARRQAS